MHFLDSRCHTHFLSHVAICRADKTGSGVTEFLMIKYVLAVKAKKKQKQNLRLQNFNFCLSKLYYILIIQNLRTREQTV